MSASGVPGPRPQERKRGHLTTYGVGRTCAYEECGTTLSRYNDAHLCWYHVEVVAATRP